jgi:hypothetical protein
VRGSSFEAAFVLMGVAGVSRLLAVNGGLLGLAIAFGACRLFSSWQPGFDLPIATALRPNSRVLWFTLALALLTTVLFGLIPALRPVESRLRRWTMRDSW